MLQHAVERAEAKEVAALDDHSDAAFATIDDLREAIKRTARQRASAPAIQRELRKALR